MANKALSLTEQRKKHFKTHEDLKSEYETYFKDRDKDVSDYIYYQGGRFIWEETYPNDGKKRDIMIYNSRATIAHNTLTSGLYSNITSPALKWFRQTIDDRELKENKEVKEYFEKVTSRILTDLANSKFYHAMMNCYAEISAFGTTALQIEPDPIRVFKFIPYTIGQYFINADSDGYVNWISREFSMRANDVVDKFGEDNVSYKVKRAIAEDKTGNDWIKILHIQERNRGRDVTKLDSKNKPFRSIYYEYDNEKREAPLRVSGYDTQPFVVGRWRTIGTDVWGTGPGQDALSDTMMLQDMESLKLQSLERQVNKPLVVDSSAGDLSINAGPDGITWVDNVTQGNAPTISQLYQRIDPLDLQKLQIEKDVVERRIEDIFYVSLFSLLTQSRGTNETATAVIERVKEKLILLGPIVERMFSEFLIPLIERCYDIEEKLGRLPIPPRILQNQEIKTEIISQIKQAQEFTKISPIMELSRMAQEFSQTWPQALDKFNPEQALDVMANARGADPSVIYSDEEVEQKRALEREAIKKQQMLEQAQRAVDSAKTLSETDVGGDNALNALLSNARGV